MKFEEYRTQCACCGGEVITRNFISRYVPDCYLDGKPLAESELLAVEECPHCHYCALSIDEPIDDIIKDLVKSDKYQQIFNSPDYDAKDIRYKGAARLAKSAREKSILYMTSAWYLEMQGKDEVKMRQKALQYMEKAFSEEGITEDDALIYIDCLRQLGKFEEALEQINDIEDDLREIYASDDQIICILDFEKKLLVNKDKMPHKFSEV